MLNEQTFAELKQRSATKRCTLSELVDQLLRDGINKQKQRKRKNRQAPKLPIFSMGEPVVNIERPSKRMSLKATLLLGIAIADRDELEEAMKA